ncbi:hypothetical protein NQ317_012462 [Molorchus minor]|uniref:WDR19 WD40 repeat domain-containing protein n=1 Tax=Molorchus minor TaxID=1323400 RepID=A0ABQ9JBK6_9CUCU|nr:hypothetical protein NQ317_012462 [Molorchus minor]
MGHIIYFHVEEWAKAIDYRHHVGVTAIYGDPAGTRLVFMDAKSKGYLYNAVINEVIPISDLPARLSVEGPSVKGRSNCISLRNKHHY